MPCDPSPKVSSPGPVAFLAIARGMNVELGKVLKNSCTEQLQFESDASVDPTSAGWMATTWTSLKHEAPPTVKLPNGAIRGTGVPVDGAVVVAGEAE